jgi:bifunctional non-homologous end joining protein LigD
MRLRLVREPFDNPEYLMEWKADGFRALAYVENGEAKLVSRNLKSLRFESLRASLAKLPVTNAILDGEIVRLDANGVSQFNWLLSGRRSGQAIFYAFDLLWLDGADLRRTPLRRHTK